MSPIRSGAGLDSLAPAGALAALSATALVPAAINVEPFPSRDDAF